MSMTTKPTIFEHEPTVRITQREYQQLLEYKAICRDIFDKFGGELEWTAPVTQAFLMKSSSVQVKTAKYATSTATKTTKTEMIKMLNEIKLLRKQAGKDEIVRVVLLRNNWEVTINHDDILHITETGMLRIVRPNGRLTSINPSHISMICTSKRGAY